MPMIVTVLGKTLIFLCCFHIGLLCSYSSLHTLLAYDVPSLMHLRSKFSSLFARDSPILKPEV